MTLMSASKGVLAIGDYGLCITLAASSSNSSLHFVPYAAVSSDGDYPLSVCVQTRASLAKTLTSSQPAVVLPLSAEWAGCVVIDICSGNSEVHASLLPEVLRVMSKGAQINITKSDKDADSKAWVDRLVPSARSRLSAACVCGADTVS